MKFTIRVFTEVCHLFQYGKKTKTLALKKTFADQQFLLEEKTDSLLCKVYLDTVNKGLEIVVSKESGNSIGWMPKTTLTLVDESQKTISLDFNEFCKYGLFHPIPDWKTNDFFFFYTIEISLESMPVAMEFFGSCHAFSELDGAADTKITFDDGHVYVSLPFLAVSSSLFLQLLREKQKEEKDKFETYNLRFCGNVDPFISLLRVLYPPHADITDNNFHVIKEQAIYYGMDYINKKCEAFLKKKEANPIKVEKNV